MIVIFVETGIIIWKRSFITTKLYYKESGRVMIKCCISTLTVYSIPFYTDLSTQKWENVKFKENNKLNYHIPCNFVLFTV